jgi:hypothetical protein
MIRLSQIQFVRRFVRGMLCSLLMAGGLLGSSAPPVAHARPLDKAQCRFDQVLPGGAGDEPFGAREVVSQVFALGVPARVCGVRLWLRRNAGRAPAGPVVLTLLAGDQDAPLFTATLPAGALREGATGAFTFSFGCDRFGPPPAPYYALQLSSPESASGAYTLVSDVAWDLRWPLGYALVSDASGRNQPGGYTMQVFTCQ